MAKLNAEQAQLQLTTLEQTVNFLIQSNQPVPEFILAQLEAFKKIVQGSSSQQLANALNELVANRLNAGGEETKAVRESLLAIGEKVRVTLTAVKGEDGEVTLKFEAASGGGGATGVSSGNAGGTREASKYNHYKVTVASEVKDKDGKVYEYPSNEFTAGDNGGKQTLKFILNGGNNPMNFPTTYGEGNSANRVLEQLQKNEIFAANFTLEMGKVEKAPATEAAPATTEAAPAEVDPSEGAE